MEEEKFCNVEDWQMGATLNNPIIIVAPKWAKYLSEFKEFKKTLPNGIFNKKELIFLKHVNN